MLAPDSENQSAPPLVFSEGELLQSHHTIDRQSTPFNSICDHVFVIIGSI